MNSFSGLLSNAALMMTLCVVYDTFGLYTISRKALRDFLTGLFVGLLTIVVMLTPWYLQPGVFFDTRWVLLSLCGLFFGTLPTSVAVIIAGAFRLYQGGAGGTVGTLVIVSTACTGLLWRYWVQRYQKTIDWMQLYLFGVVVQFVMLSCMIFMPAEMRMPIIKAVAPPILLIYPFLTLIIGLILKKQEDRRNTDRELEENRQKLASEKERLAVTLRSIGDGVITTDTAGNIVLLNSVAEKLTGWNRAEAEGRPLSEVFHIINEQTRKACENPATRVLESGENVDLVNHTVLIAKDGSEYNIADSGAPIRDSESNIVGVVLVFRDVTEQLKMDKELLKIKKLESIGILAGGIAHDFNNILAAIVGNINLALYDKSLQNNTRDLLSEAEKASLRAKDLTQQLLTFSKGGEPIKETASLEKVIKDSAGFVLHGKKIACHYDIPQDLWLVNIDKGQISQVIQNIVINASHAMPDGGLIDISCENITVSDIDTLAQGAKERFVKICITDSGIGIPESLVDKIFDPYFSTKQEGSGLGLAITQSIITKHHGRILVESSAGEGTTFSIYLPAAEGSEATSNLSHAIDSTEQSPQANILIMDDEEMVRTVTGAMLKKIGHTVEMAKDGETAINLYKQAMNTENSFDLIIMDLTIPGGMGGRKAAKEILKLNPEAKIIVSSGYSNDPVLANFQDYGFCSALVKPFQLQGLSKTLNELLN